MKKSVKTIISLVLVSVMALCFSVNIFAIDDQAQYVTPRWTSIYHIDLDIVFSGTTGTFAAVASKQSTASLIEGTVYLYKWVNNDWQYIDEWYKSKAVGTLGIGADFTAERGVTYKVVFEVTAYTNGVPETETVEYSETCPRN